jgi:hypothetical protein
MIGVFSTKLENASRDQFGDIVALLQESSAFAAFKPFITSTRIRMYTPAQLRAGAAERKEAGLLEIRAVSTTASSARGPALIALVFDEFAHVTGTGSTSDSTSIARSATPALAQFRNEAFVFMASSPASMTGQFYESYLDACAVDADTGESINQDTLLLQLASWDMYMGWEHAHELEMWPGGPRFSKITRPVILETDPEIVSTKRRDPWAYRCEYEAMWVGSAGAYFTPAMVDGIFARFKGEVLHNQTAPTAGRAYVMHIDPSSVGDNTALVIGHLEIVDFVDHGVLDVVRSWSPADFEGGIPYDLIAEEAAALIRLFDPVSVTIDSFSGLPLKQMIDKLVPPPQSRFTLAAHAGRARVVHANTREKLARYERTKLMAHQGRLHAPYVQLLRDELMVLERHDTRIGAPTSGPIQTDDTVDATTIVVAKLTDGTSDISARFSAASGRNAVFDPNSPVAQQFTRLTEDRRRNRRRGY